MRFEQRALADGRKPAASHVSPRAVRQIRRRPQGRTRSVRGRRDGGTWPGHLGAQADWEGLNFDLIVTLAPEAHHKALELTRTLAADVEYWPTHDPTGAEGNREQKLQAYREVCDGVFLRIRKRFSKVGAASG